MARMIRYKTVNHPLSDYIYLNVYSIHSVRPSAYNPDVAAIDYGSDGYVVVDGTPSSVASQLNSIYLDMAD